MTPTLQASDLDIPQEVWDAATTHEMDEAVRSFGKPSVALACARAILAERQSLSAQLAAEKARAEALDRELDAQQQLEAIARERMEAAEARADKAEGELAGTKDKLNSELNVARLQRDNAYSAAADHLARAEANLAAANKQIEEMRGAEPLAWAYRIALNGNEGPPKWGPWALHWHSSNPSAAIGGRFEVQPLYARTALSHEARNGTGVDDERR